VAENEIMDRLLPKDKFTWGEKSRIKSNFFARKTQKLSLTGEI
jgi:hypothetical protein